MQAKTVSQALAAAATVALLAACAMPAHNNVLIFTTQTKVALDIANNPTTGFVEATLGYKRNESVWMPLVANQASGSATDNKHRIIPVPCTNQHDDCPLLQGQDRAGQLTDTYSVLATFSGSGGGVAQSPQVAASAASAASAGVNGSIAQFFATGVAAQKLASGTGNPALFNTAGAKSSDGVAKEAAKQAMAQAAVMQGGEPRKAVVAEVDDFIERASANDNFDAGIVKTFTESAAAAKSITASRKKVIDRRADEGEDSLRSYLLIHWPRNNLGQALMKEASK